MSWLALEDKVAVVTGAAGGDNWRAGRASAKYWQYPPERRRRRQY